MNQERIHLLKQYIREEPNNPFNHYALAMEYYQEDPDEARTIFNHLLHDHPEYLPTYFKAAHLLWENEEMGYAEKVFQEGIVLAKKQNDQKALQELSAAYHNFQFERD